MSLDEKIVSISSKFDYTGKTKFKHGMRFVYEMPREEEFALNLIARLEGREFCPYLPFNNSHDLFNVFNDLEMFVDLGQALGLAAMAKWDIDDKTLDSHDLLHVPFEIGNVDLYNLISEFNGGIDEQEVTRLHYSFFINSFFEHFNKKEDRFRYNIMFSDLRDYRREALKNEDFELLDYLSEKKLIGFSPTRLIGNRKYWNL